MTTKVASKHVSINKNKPASRAGNIIFLTIVLIIVGIAGAMILGYQNFKKMESVNNAEVKMSKIIAATTAIEFETNKKKCDDLGITGVGLCRLSNNVFAQCASEASSWSMYNACSGQFEQDFCVNSMPNETFADTNKIIKCQQEILARYKLAPDRVPDAAIEIIAAS